MISLFSITGAIPHAHKPGASGVCLLDFSNVDRNPMDGW